MNVLVSACLVGLCTRYDGSSRPADLSALAGATLIPVCPEQLGGLPTPRPPAERQPDGSVRSAAGEDVTAAFVRGAGQAARVCALCGCSAALLKARSPSCGLGEMYDGSFTGTLVAGNGVFADMLLRQGPPVYTEDDIMKLAEDFGLCNKERIG